MQQPVAYARRGRVGGQPPPLTIENKNHSFWNDPLFFIERFPKLLSCFSALSNLLINLEKLSL